MPVTPRVLLQALPFASAGSLPQIEGMFNNNASNGSGAALFLLGHDIASMYPEANPDEESLDFYMTGFNPYVGEDSFKVNMDFGYNGFSLVSLTHAPEENLRLSFDFFNTMWDMEGWVRVGSIVFASYYDIPQSPDLSLTLGWKYEGFDEQTKYTGSSTSNMMWSKPPKWGRMGPWELGKPAEWIYEEGLVYPNATSVEFYKSGRRTWDLQFSYLDEKDFWGSNQMLEKHLETPAGLDADDIENGSFKYNIITDNNFFSQVWNRTLGGILPFIFQPDRNNFNPDQFAICRFKENSIKVEQSAYGVYDISLTIEETW